MKKFIFSAIAAIGLLLSPSCSDENEALSGSGNEALVSFSVNLADGIQTKASIGDGTKAKNLVVDVFEKNTTNDEYTQVGGLRQKHDGAFNDGLTTTVNFNLVKGKTYRLIFWAQKQSVVSSNANSPYNIDDLSKIKVNYDAGITVDEDRDAFLYVTDPITVSGNFTKSVEMTRPFAQLNYLIDKAEYDAAVAAGMVIQKAKVTVAKVATELYPLKNSVGALAEDVQFEITDFPTNFNNLEGQDYINLPQPGAQTPTNKDYYYLASKYFLVYAGDGAENKAGAPATLATTSLKLQDASGDIANYEFKVPAVPVRRNYRTNIYGNLITSEGTFNVTIDKNFNSPDNDLPQSAAVVNSAGEIYSAIVNDKATTIIASESFPLSTSSTAPTTITVPRTYASGNNGVELTFDLSKATVTSGTANITLSYSSDSQHAPENVNVIASGNITIDLEDSHVTLNRNEVSGGTYNTVIASTSGNTLVVPNGVTVTTLKVKKGKVRIEKGGKVGTIENETDPKTDVIVYLEDGGILETMPDASTRIIVVQQSIISNAAELRAFAESVNRGYTYEGETVVLTADIDLNNTTWTPIGLNADDAKKFKGTFDGQGHTIRNLKVNQGESYHAAGLFGTLNGTAKNFTIDRATIESTSAPSNNGRTDNGTAVVAGSIYPTGIIEGVTVKNATVNGNCFVGGIAGYVYGSIKDCTVESSTITSTPDKLTGTYDNGDKAGGIAGYVGEGSYTLSGNTVKNLRVEAYRDVAGIAGCIQTGAKVENNTVDEVTVIANMLQDGGEHTLEDANANEVVGRNLANANLSTNTTNNVTVTIYGIDSEGVATVGTDAGVTYAINKGATTINLKDGKYNATILKSIAGKTLTFIGDGLNTIFDYSSQIYNEYVSGGGGNFTFKNMTIQRSTATFAGMAHTSKTSYKDCTITGTYFVYETTAEFTNCKFNVTGDAYNCWLYGTSKTTYTECTFNCSGKSIYVDGNGDSGSDLITEKCTFNDNGDVEGKAAIETGTTYGKRYSLTINETTVNGFSVTTPKKPAVEGAELGTCVWGNKDYMTKDKLSVTIDGNKVY